MSRETIGAPVRALLALYFIASLAHFAHNAAYVAFYPGVPAWLGPGTIWLAWCAVTLVGMLGVALAALGRAAAALSCLAAYGALGLDSLGHYTLALCSEHTLAMNATIAFEALAGTGLMVGSLVALMHRRRIATV